MKYVKKNLPHEALVKQLAKNKQGRAKVPTTTVSIIKCPNCDGNACDFTDQVFCEECGYITHKV